MITRILGATAISVLLLLATRAGSAVASHSAPVVGGDVLFADLEAGGDGRLSVSLCNESNPSLPGSWTTGVEVWDNALSQWQFDKFFCPAPLGVNTFLLWGSCAGALACFIPDNLVQHTGHQDILPSARIIFDPVLFPPASSFHEQQIVAHEWGHNMSLSEHGPDDPCDPDYPTVMGARDPALGDPCINGPNDTDKWSVECAYDYAQQEPDGTPPADCDGDGYADRVEYDFPLCYNGINEDSPDDNTPDDGCLSFNRGGFQGMPQVGLFSEGAFRVGTDRFGRCAPGAETGPSTRWPSDFQSGGIPFSTDKITLTDLTSFLAPQRRLSTSPGDNYFSIRWDLSPGPGVFGKWINVSDLTSVIAGTMGFPPMFGGAKAFNGPTCTAHPMFGD